MGDSQTIANRFTIDDPQRDLLGRGGMGLVYRATDTLTGHPVAVKALKPDVVADDPDLVARFVREGQALRQLDHPNIVKMVAAIQEADQHYLVMEYVEGGDLRDLMNAQGPLPVKRALEIALEVADALTRAHHLHIIHRDLKPANVLLAHDGTPRLTDFGLARVAGTPRLTQADVVMGTLDYLCPEACHGQELDPRADIWAFGVLLFEMLTGERPFTGDTPAATLLAILTDPVPDLAQIRPETPDALADLVYRMLEKDSLQRIPSVRLVGAEIEAILQQREPLSTTPYPYPAPSRFAAPTPQTGERRHNLPAQPTPFVGREVELAELDRLLGDPAVRLLTVLGPGGMGKTRLALEAGAAQLDDFAHGVYFVPLAPLQAPDAILPTVAEAIGFSFYTAEGGARTEPRQQLLDHLWQKQMLLIFDNFGHLLASPEPGRGDGVDLATAILETAPGVKILATSRARLNVQGEHLFHLAGMDFPAPPPQVEAATPEDALEYSAVKLFLQSARRVRPAFDLHADDLQHVSRICRLVGGLPLGILLAAAWIEMLSPSEIADEIGRSLDFLETDLRDVPERQRSIRAVFDTSWNILAEREQKAFQALSVFRGGFTREAAQEVTESPLAVLRALVAKSLLRLDPGGRYEIHELLRQYAAEHLGKTPRAADAVGDRHCAYYVRFLQQREARLRGKDQRQTLAEIGMEIENVRAAWDRAVAKGRIEDIHRCLDSLAEFHRIRGWYQDGEHLLARAVHSLAGVQEDRAPAESKMVLGKAQVWYGRFCHGLGRAEQASQLLQAGLAVFRDLGAERETAYTLCHLRESSDPLEEDLCLEALAISQRIDDQRGVALALRGLAHVALSQGKYAVAKQRFRDSLSLFKQLCDQEGMLGSLDGLGSTAFSLGEYREARRLHEEMLALCQETGDQVGMAQCLSSLGHDAAGLQEYDEAIRRFQESLAVFRKIGSLVQIASALSSLGVVAETQGNYRQAAQFAEESLSVSEHVRDRAMAAKALRVLGSAACRLGDYPEAKRYFHQALEAAAAMGMPSVTLLTLARIAALRAAQGEKEAALEMVGLVIYHPTSPQWAKDIAVPLLAELEAELPPGVVAQAKERGQARDLDTTVAELLIKLGE